MDNRLTGYTDFEGVMIHLSKERGWEFKFTDEQIPVQSVFNHSTYAPALLTLAKAELETRHIPSDLGIRLEGESNSLFGARVVFDDGQNSFLSQIWRLAATAMIVESLPKDGNYIVLDPLQYVLGDAYAAYATREIE
ncbi:hypothetical protein [Chromobacterium haemolyticum]|uniref:hypothetical protein n=1 Tax=Chromobacterium haemolyticum TaxID=394935 RepID=UPI00244B28C0|nr:hypothetical protein [Chromobacterium haemolyticum]MDH0342148.1 hypothetical protein [Chromobacterium haemolyticum]